MKFERLSENKIRITLSMRDLEEKDISFHDFMSNSLESQDLFLDMLQEAEKEVGFQTRNCKVKIEAFAMTEDDFILTITRVLPENPKKRGIASPRRTVKAKRKTNCLQYTYLIYKFRSFDDYCNFIEFLLKNNLKDSYKIAKEISVYIYGNIYYLVLTDLNAEYRKITKFLTSITEFGSYVANPELFVHKINETGIIFLKNNAFKKSFLHYSK